MRPNARRRHERPRVNAGDRVPLNLGDPTLNLIMKDFASFFDSRKNEEGRGEGRVSGNGKLNESANRSGR